MKDETRLEKIRWILSLLGLGLLIVALYTVLRPFLIPVGWAIILVLTTWPVHRTILRRFPRRPGMVAFLSTSLLAVILLVAIVPLMVKFATELQHTIRETHVWLTAGELHAPETVRNLPLVGSLIEDKLLSLKTESEQLMAFANNYRNDIVRLATLAARGLFEALFKIVMCLVTAFFLYRYGAQLGRQVSVATIRVGGARFDHLLQTSKATIKGAVYGVLATAVAQGILAGIGYLVAGAPFPLVLGFATMGMSLVPFGTPLVYLPVSIYIIIGQGSWLAGGLLAVWGVAVVSTVDNLLRPYFISQATQAPVLMVFFGVVGGIMSFGLIGIFIGPVILALAQALWLEWVTGSDKLEQSS